MSHKHPPDSVSEPCKNQSDATWGSDVPGLSLSPYWMGICYLAGSAWQICFEHIIYPVLCSWVCFFSPFAHAAASRPVLSSSSQAPVSLETISTDPLHCCPWLEPPSQILGKNRLSTFQEASPRLSKSAMQNRTPEDIK